jgi:tRNA1(Val) A37 N6-methylase TrmN6
MSLDHTSKIVKQQTLTRDAFLGGRLHVSQPGNGFRAGMDSVLLGAAVGRDEGQLADLGAGTGVAGLTALVHAQRLRATLVDSDPAAVHLARENVAANSFADRAEVIGFDVTEGARERIAAGLRFGTFASVIANPPFFTAGAGTPASKRGTAARHMPSEDLVGWVVTAATIAKPRGEIIFIAPAAMLPRLLLAFEGRAIALTVLPLTPRDDQPTTRVLVRGIKGSRAPFKLLASRALHEPEGRGFRPEFEAIFRGDARLIW